MEAVRSGLRVLIVDDDEELREMLSEYLAERDFEVTTEGDGLIGLERACHSAYSLLVLDVRLPGLDGFEMLRRLRASNGDGAQVPVIMLTAHGDEIDRIVGLELGADDYLPKPFNPRELLARMRAILRRAATDKAATPAEERADTASELPTEKVASNVLRCGEVEMDTDARLVRHNGETLELSASEFDLLSVLLREAGRVVKRETLARDGLGRRLLPLDRSLDIHVCNLRHKLWPDDTGLNHIKTVRGIGYMLVNNDPANSAPADGERGDYGGRAPYSGRSGSLS